MFLYAILTVLLILFFIGSKELYKDLKLKAKKFFNVAEIHQDTRKKISLFEVIFPVVIILPSVISRVTKKNLATIVSLIIFLSINIFSYLIPRYPFLDYVMVGAFAHLIYSLCKFFLSDNGKLEHVFGVTIVGVLICVLDYTFLEGMAGSAIRGTLRFRLVIVTILVLFIPFFYSMKSILDKSRSVLFIGIAALVTFIMPVLYMLMIFGIYNLSHPDTLSNSLNASQSQVIIKQLLDKHDLYDYLMVIQHGAQNVFQLPGVSLTLSGVPIIEYLFGMILNLIVVGFFVSYATTIVSDINKRKKILHFN